MLVACAFSLLTPAATSAAGPAVDTRAIAEQQAAGAAPVKPARSIAVVTRKSWNELSPGQQKALKPLATSWDSLDEAQQRKWQALSRNFNRMPPTEQILLHSRMTEWAALSPTQRTLARLNFAQAKALPADEKRARWQAYQALSTEERQRLAATALRHPRGAAAALKPTTARKIVVPAVRRTQGSDTPAVVRPVRRVHEKTLLPLPVDPAP